MNAHNEKRNRNQTTRQVWMLLLAASVVYSSQRTVFAQNGNAEPVPAVNPAHTDTKSDAAKPKDAKTMQAQVDRLAKPLVDGEIVTGLCIGIIDGDKTYVYGYGVTGAKSDREAVPNGDTIFEIGSVTKTFTGLLLADAVQHGKARLDEPVTDLLPAGWSVPSKDGKTITLLDLATHRSGLPRMPSNFAPRDAANPYADYGETQIAAYLKTATPEHAPGEQYDYSNLGAGLLGVALAHRAGTSYETLLKTRITQPLGMTATTLTLTPESRRTLAIGHNEEGDPVSIWDFDALAGAGAIRSTVHDMMRYLSAYLHPEGKPLADALPFAASPHRLLTPPSSGQIGLGWHIHPDGVTRWHNGQTGGYHSYVAFNPKTERGVVVLCNTAAGEVDALGTRLMQMAQGETPAPVPIRAVVSLKPEQLAACAGSYALAPNFILKVTAEGHRLYAQATGQTRLRLYPASESEFFYRGVNAQVTFQRDANGRVTGLVLHQHGRDMPAQRQE